MPRRIIRYIKKKKPEPVEHNGPKICTCKIKSYFRGSGKVRTCLDCGGLTL